MEALLNRHLHYLEDFGEGGSHLLAPRLASRTGRARWATAAGMTRPLAAITRLADVRVSSLAMGRAWATRN